MPATLQGAENTGTMRADPAGYRLETRARNRHKCAQQGNLMSMRSKRACMGNLLWKFIDRRHESAIALHGFFD
jgi:hypothetical protein